MNDPINFCTAEEYFKEIPNWGGPTKVVSASTTPPADIKDKAGWHGVNLTFDDGTVCVIQYVRPTLWRVRYDAAVRDSSEYSDLNRLVDTILPIILQRPCW